MPVLGKQASPGGGRVGWNVEHTAQRQAMPHVAAGPFLRRQVAVVLRDRGLVHGRAEVGRVSQSFGKGVVRQEAEPVGISSANVYVGRVIPTLRRVLQPVDRAHGKSLALDNRVWIAAGR